ncbi:MAG: 4-(cytidine 5'-diphospho)-2-C-methyl-D-erythritol kinase, partial [Lentisphaerae bacterium]|nr:4-(cytidine 5'-diphospho)-2-C-methyl-D-erythritol kinase [Lentisphaerota bacterium]
PDGYHDIKSLLAPIDLHDRLSMEVTDGGIEVLADTTVRLPGLPGEFNMGPVEDNLVTRAAHLLREAAGCRQGVRIRLEKHIPIAAGLAGGSADAAATLLGLNRLWCAGLQQTDLLELARRLGCDVPALVHGGVVCMSGRGDILEPADWRPGWRPWLLLVNPGFVVSTGDIYGRYRPCLTSNGENSRFDALLDTVKNGDGGGLARGLFNALQETVFEKYPLLRMLHVSLEEAGVKALLSGTGATIFGLVRDAEHGCKVAEVLCDRLDVPLWWRVVQVLEDRTQW